MIARRTYGIWLLKLVPPIRWGRWLTEFLLLALLLAAYWFSGVFTLPGMEPQTKAAALFFCVIIAYITPTYHFIVERTLIAFDALEPELKLVERQLAQSLPDLRSSIHAKPWGWHLTILAITFAIWLVQSWFLAGGTSGMIYGLTSNSTNFSMAIGPLFVWLFTSTAIGALVANARLFYQLALVIPIELLNPGPLMWFGRMAVSATLVMVGTLAALSLLWLGGISSPWASVPGFVLVGAAMLYLLLVPTLPLRQRIRATRSAALGEVQQAIDAVTPQPLLNIQRDELVHLNQLLAWRGELQRVSEWPFDMHVLARLGLYIVIVPLTWVGAALIENLVDFLIE